MKKIMMLACAVLVCAGVAMAQTYTSGTGIQNIDKLGAHQNGGRGCTGCHAPHSGARGNGGTMQWNPSLNSGAGGFQSVATVGTVGDMALWGQDIGPAVGLSSIKTGDGGTYTVPFTNLTANPRIQTGVIFCLSCHDGNVAKGAMMTGRSFEQAAGLLPPTYGTQPIPTLLGNDGGTVGDYSNDHPIGPSASVGSLSIGTYLALNASPPTQVVASSSFSGSAYQTFQKNYGLPTILGARSGAGLAVETTMTSVSQAYVVCDTCHTPHSMYITSASSSNPIAGSTTGNYPTYFFIAAPYNPGANTANGTKASSATQFCRQCHFTGAGGSNEGSGINNIPTAF